MDLKKQDVAELLAVSMQTIDNFIKLEKIPYYILTGEHRFNRQEIENWMIDTLSSEKEQLPFGEVNRENCPWQQFGLYRAIHRGDVLDGVVANSKYDMIKSTMDRVADKLFLDAEMVTELLMERENLMPTYLNNGVAAPHTREFLLDGLFDAVVVVYPSKPIEWGGLDRSLVHTLFFIFACDDKRHLNLLAKIANFINSKECMEFITNRPNKSKLLNFVKQWEINMSLAIV